MMGNDGDMFRSLLAAKSAKWSAMKKHAGQTYATMDLKHQKQNV